VLAQRRLGDTEFFGNQDGTYTVLYQVAIHLRAEMSFWIFQPLQNLKSPIVRESLQCLQTRHIVSLLNVEVLVKNGQLSRAAKRFGASGRKERDVIRAEQIRSTYELLAPHIRRTPVVEIDLADFNLHPGSLSLKLESLQHAGSFKSRGAFSNLLTRTIPSVGVVAASGGNHGAAVAFAAMKLGVPAKIFVPGIASAAKIQQITEYGAELVIAGERYADALAASESWVAESGAMPVHAFDQVETLLGQGTVGLEFEEQASALDTLLVSVGGGGLIAGIAAWYRGKIRVVGVEPEKSPTLTRALEAGQPVDAETGGIAADSLAPRRVGELVFPIVQRFVAETVLVSDDAIREAQRQLWKVVRVVAEPGGAAAFAALISGRYVPRPPERVGVLICGGNTVAVDFGRS
jgi:threonine dehydratase